MGQLGMWGALAGAGKGIATNAQRAAEQQAVQQAEQLAAKRQERLENLRARNRAELQFQRDAASSERLEATLESREGLSEAEINARRDIAEGNNRTTLTAAGLRTTATRDLAEYEAEQDRVAQEREQAADRWSFSKITTGEFKEAPILRDKKSGRQFMQVGNVFMPYNHQASESGQPMQPRIPPSATSDEAYSWLSENYRTPGALDMFLEEYGYLPASIISRLSQAPSGEPGGTGSL